MIHLLKNILNNQNSTEEKESNTSLELLCGLMIEAAYTDGKIDEIELPIHISNVAFLDPNNSKPTRLKYEFNKKEKIRLTVSSGSKV